MRVLFVEDALDGHHVPYLQGLTSSDKYESVVLIPECDERIKARQIRLKFPQKNWSDYWKWICAIAKETRNNHYDVVHFVDGDSIMRYFGLGFSLLRARKIVITYHGFYPGFPRALSYRMMCANRTAVVHTEVIQKNLQKTGVKTVNHVEYPSFSYTAQCALVQNDVPVLGALGATRKDKGLDLLLKALEKVHSPYRLLIAGKALDITQDDIEAAKPKLSGRIEYNLDFLSEAEFTRYLNMVDIFVIPYRRSFDGASGPLVEGVARGKMIIGASHGSIGRIITDNHIGKTFESENIEELAAVIEQSLQSQFVYDEVATAYKRRLTVDGFQSAYFAIYSAGSAE